MGDIVAAIIEGIISIFSTIIEFIASFFTVGAEALSAGDALAVFFMLVIELIFWLILWIIELIVCLFTWRKPKKITKPKLWRPKSKNKLEIDDNNESKA